MARAQWKLLPKISQSIGGSILTVGEFSTVNKCAKREKRSLRINGCLTVIFLHKSSDLQVAAQEKED